ncbi:MAG TPA: MFS transporter [Candidatus Izemoplasmatales bacterium]|nr:MFS transporter [Candidatus Izemoplasmatales bacterium]
MEKLWNRNFGILTIGSFVSALGSAAAGFGFGVLIYQKTGSPLLLALFTVANLLPRMITGFLIGPFIDRHSRIQIIYLLDFFSALCFTGVATALFFDYYDTLVFTLLAGFFGVIDTVYQVAFMTLFPEAIPKGQHSRAYSIASLLWPVAGAIMTPLAAYLAENLVHGIAWLMAINALSYLIAALVETTMRFNETVNRKTPVHFQFVEDFREGFGYFRKEKGIFWITMLFMAFSFGYAVHDLLTLPFFMAEGGFTLQDFSFVMSANMVGRIVGGFIHYFIVYPPKKRFAIAVSVYLIVELIAATLLFIPVLAIIIGISFVNGLLSVTSYTIRMSATQAYIPGQLRGRINSTQGFLWNIGTIIGALVTGFVAEYGGFDYRVIFLMSAVITFGAIFLIPLRRREEFKKIYNAEV